MKIYHHFSKGKGVLLQKSHTGISQTIARAVKTSGPVNMLLLPHESRSTGSKVGSMQATIAQRLDPTTSEAKHTLTTLACWQWHSSLSAGFRGAAVIGAGAIIP